MKKNILICLFAAVLTVSGCGKKEEADTEQENVMVSIAETDFTQAQAESLLKQAVKEHCGTEYACKVTAVKIAGRDITGTYTYQEDDKTMQADVRLSDVTINRNDPNIFDIGSSSFSSPAAAEKEPAADKPAETAENKTDKDKDSTKTPTDIPHLPLPDKKLDPNNEEDTKYTNVLSTDDYYVDRIYLYTDGTLHVGGTYEGNGYFRLVVLNEDQSVAKDLIHITSSEELKYETNLKAGFYYLYITSDGGSWNVEYSTTY